MAADPVEHLDDVGVGDVADPAGAPPGNQRNPAPAAALVHGAIAYDSKRLRRAVGREAKQPRVPLP